MKLFNKISSFSSSNNKKSLILLTGANGHLGNTIIKYLSTKEEYINKYEVYGLVLPSFKNSDEYLSDFKNIHYVFGDVREIDSLIESLFSKIDKTKYENVYLIHTAAIVSIANDIDPNLYDTNVNGTINIAKLCIKYNVDRMIYVSSVHALSFNDRYEVIKEEEFYDENKVVGAYAKTKAIASNKILSLIKNEGLKAIILQPSGIIGPYFLDESNHLVKLINDYVDNKMPAGVKGGYDFVDVRDVSEATISALTLGKIGESYILSNRHYEIKELFNMINKLTKHRKVPILSSKFVSIFIPLATFIAKKKKQKALFTSYALYTLNVNDKFSHDKATKFLNYNPRDLYDTLKDTIYYLKVFKSKKKKLN